jgi:1-acyl-sn-glycerol-3-phosphate acyltransferase
MMRARLYQIFSTLLFGWYFTYTAIGAIFAIILAYTGMKRLLSLIMRYWAKSIFLFMGKPIGIEGRENIRRGDKYILVANHASLFDILAIVSFYPGITWFGHERLLKVPVFGQILRMTDYVPFREPTYRNTRTMVKSLISKSKNNAIAIFPEGTRTLDGRINTFYRGFIYLYRNSDMEILPVTLNGFYELKPKNRSYINFDAQLGVTVHAPLKRDELDAKSDQEIIDLVKRIIESAYSVDGSQLNLRDSENSILINQA